MYCWMRPSAKSSSMIERVSFVAFRVSDRIVAGVHGLGVEVLDLLGDELVGEHSPVLALDSHPTCHFGVGY